MQERPDRADQPMLPFVRRNHGDAFDFLMMRFDEGGVFFEGGQIFPTRQTRGVDQQPELAFLLNDRFDLPSQLGEIARLQFRRREGPRCAA